MRIFLRVKPRAKEDKVEKAEDNRFYAFTKEPAEKGKANRAAEKLLAEYFNIPVSRVRIVLGFSSRNKIIEITK